MSPVGMMMVGAASLVAALAAGAGRRRLQEQIDELGRRMDAMGGLEDETRRHGEAIAEIRVSVGRMERGFMMLGERLSAQIKILESLQSSYADKEQKLQTTLHAVLEALSDIRHGRAAAR